MYNSLGWLSLVVESLLVLAAFSSVGLLMHPVHHRQHELQHSVKTVANRKRWFSVML